MVSSPATVPMTPASPARSRADADHVGRARRGAEHDQVAAVGHLDHPVPEHPLEVVLGRDPLLELGHGVDRLAAGHADLDRAELLEVARHRGLGGDDPVGGQQLDQLGLAGHRRAARAAGRCGAGAGSWSASCRPGRLEQPQQQAPHGVHAVGGLRPHQALGPVDDAGGDLLAPVGRQAVQDHGARARPGPSAPRRPCSRRRRRRRPAASSSWPIEIHTSVQTASAPLTASAGSAVTTTSVPRPGRTVDGHRRRARSPAGQATRTRHARPWPRPASGCGRRCCRRRPRPRSGRPARPSAAAGSAGRPAPGRDGPRSESRLTTGTGDDRGHPLEHLVVEDPGRRWRRGTGQGPGDVLDRLPDVEADLVAPDGRPGGRPAGRPPSRSSCGSGPTASRTPGPRPGRPGPAGPGASDAMVEHPGRSSVGRRQVVDLEEMARRVIALGPLDRRRWPWPAGPPPRRSRPRSRAATGPAAAPSR